METVENKGVIYEFGRFVPDPHQKKLLDRGHKRKGKIQKIDDTQRNSSETFDMAEIHAQLGDKDQACEWLEKAFKDHGYLMIYLKVAPNLDPLRSDPRFVDLLRRMGLAD